MQTDIQIGMPLDEFIDPYHAASNHSARLSATQPLMGEGLLTGFRCLVGDWFSEHL